MGILAPGKAVEHNFVKVAQNRPALGFVNDIAHGMLHETVGDDDPQGGNVAGNGHQPDAEAMQLWANPVPAEMPDRDKCRFQKKRDRGFDGQQ